MTTLKGPGIFLAQFMGDNPPFNNLQSICLWAESLGFKGVQIPTWDARCIDLQKAAESKTYADEIKGIVNDAGLQITELSTHLQGTTGCSASCIRCTIRWLCASICAWQ
jgi:sugar phosphate isomerase/epimerase